MAGENNPAGLRRYHQAGTEPDERLDNAPSPRRLGLR
jgi:hypothetical protein